MINTYISLDHSFASLETALNRLDRIPILSTPSALIRFTLGKIQILAGLTFSGAYAILHLLSQSHTSLFHARQAAQYMGHGIANMLRALVVVVPGVNLLSWAYDYHVGRVIYACEDKSSSYPLPLFAKRYNAFPAAQT